MLLIIGDHRVAILYTTEKEIPLNEWRLIRNKEQLRGYNPDDLPELVCVGHYYKLDRYRELRLEAQALGYKPKDILL